jgi:hypothetical protein
MLTCSLLLTANDQSVSAWKAANSSGAQFTRIDISEYFLYARLNGEWVYIK